MSTTEILKPTNKTSLPELNKVYQGDCLALMADWPDQFVDCTVTSPPYFNLRSYLPDNHPAKADEMGCDCMLSEYLDSMAALFTEVYRITKETGSLWLNIGDTWVGEKNKHWFPSDDFVVGEMGGIPHRLADAIRFEGWRLISEVIWHKPNTNTHSAGKRPIGAHEYLFQFVKSDQAYYDAVAIMEKSKYQEDPDRELKTNARSVWTIPTISLNGRKLMADFRENGIYWERNPNCPLHGDFAEMPPGPLFIADRGEIKVRCTCKPVDADFFAAMPPALAEKAILCSTSARGNCPECGVPMIRLVGKDRISTRPGLNCKVDPSGKSRKDPQRHVTYISTVTWMNTCCCTEVTLPSSPVVFDPFMGSGTTAVAAEMTGRNWLGCELNPVMCTKLIPARIRQLTRKAR